MDRVFLGFCEQLHYFSHADLVAVGQNPMIEGSIIVILSPQSFHQAFPFPKVCVQCRSLITCGSDGSPDCTHAETLPSWKSSGSSSLVNIRLSPAHCTSDHYLRTVFKTPVCSLLFYSYYISFHSLDLTVWLVSIFFLLCHHHIIKSLFLS